MTTHLVTRPLPGVAMDGLEVPLVTGGTAPYRHLDHAASAPGLVAVEHALARCYPLITAIHRGPGYPSAECTRLYEETRGIVARFVGAPDDCCVILTSGTTAGLNILAQSLVGRRVVGFALEHHANMLPWQDRCDYTMLPVPGSEEELFGRLDAQLRHHPGGFVTVTGASNVTGERPTLDYLTDLVRSHGAELIVDAAQLAPHHRIDMRRDGIAALVLSGHKLGATSAGLGALIAPRSWLVGRAPLIRGGGAVDYVHADGVRWSPDPTVRHEAGSANVPGAIALGVACRTLMGTGMTRISGVEGVLLDVAYQGLRRVPGLTIHQLWPGHASVPVITFTLGGMPYGLLAAVLSAEYGIGVRSGCFCAHQLVAHLLGIDPKHARSLYTDAQSGRAPLPGAVRVSLGHGTTTDTLTVLFDALNRITENGPKADYQCTTDRSHWWPVPDPRPPLVTYGELGEVREYRPLIAAITSPIR